MAEAGDGEGRRELRVWAAVRTDLGMTDGKLVAQAGHAFEWLAVSQVRAGSATFEAYLAGASPKVAVAVRNEHALRRVAAEAEAAGIPHVLVVDEGRTELGGPTATVVAFGPAYRDELPRYLERLRKLSRRGGEPLGGAAPRADDAAG